MRRTAFCPVGSSVIVTGAGRGIGAAAAVRLAADGLHVVACDLDAAGLHDTRDRIVANSGSCEVLTADVTSPQDCQQVAERAASGAQPLRGLVNNAAVGAFAMDVESTTLAEWNRIIAADLTSVFLMSKVSIPLIRAAGGGVIVNVSSVHAYATSPAVAPYAAAKGGVLALTRTMALDLAVDSIRVMALVPGAVDTPMLQSHAEREGKSLAELGFPSGPNAIARIADPEEIAGTIAFLLSRDATFMTGSALVADGGMLAKF
ncbi:MAG: SDR family oxidoreductase [Actinomycetales bacterium]|nr:SDR family oxidoreductase [Actinomycetales bacterium]